MKTRHKALFLLLGLVIGVAGSAYLGPSEEELIEGEYCRMVALNRADPSIGWPDYNNNYDEVCHAKDATR